MPKNISYKLSWVNRFMVWLSRLPLPVWLSLALIYVMAVLGFHIARWNDGFPVGIDPESVYNGVWSVISLIFFFIIENLVNKAIARFSVLVPGKKKQLEEIRDQMISIPPTFAFWALVFMAAVIVAGSYFSPTFLYEGIRSPASYAILIAVAVFSYAFGPIFIVQGFRQLQAVVKAYELVSEINIFHLQPLYAFSGLTMTMSLFWIVVLNMSFYGNLVMTPHSSLPDLILTFAFGVPLIVLAFVTFIYPLLGIHQRILRAKEKALEENGLEIDRVHKNVYRNLRSSKYKTAGDAERSLTSLYKMREQIEKVPTWPWHAGSLRNFLSAVFLPLGLWLLQQYLRGLLSL